MKTPRVKTAGEWVLAILGTAVSGVLVAAAVALFKLPAQMNTIQTDVTWMKAAMLTYYPATSATEVHKRLEQKNAQQDHEIESLKHRVSQLEDHGR